MKIAAYQFAVSSCMDENFNKMQSAIIQAAEKDVRLLIFPECALTGYPSYDISKASDVDFEMVSNTCHILTVDTIYPYQTAPTVLFDKSGRVLQELERNIPGMLYYELDNFNYDFGEKGRKCISDYLIKRRFIQVND